MRAKRPAAPKYKWRIFCTAPPRPAGTGKVSASGTAAGGLPPARRAQGPPPDPLTAPPGFLAWPSFRPGGRLEGGGPCPPLFAPPAFFGYIREGNSQQPPPPSPPAKPLGGCPAGECPRTAQELARGPREGGGVVCPPSLSRFSPACAFGAGGKERGRKRPATGWPRHSETSLEGEGSGPTPRRPP